MGACLLLLAALTAAPAQAAAPRTIAEYGQGAGEVTKPQSITADRSSGDVYVADRSNFRVLRFDSDGGFVLGWGYGVADGLTEELQACGPGAIPPTVRCF